MVLCSIHSNVARLMLINQVVTVVSSQYVCSYGYNVVQCVFSVYHSEEIVKHKVPCDTLQSSSLLCMLFMIKIYLKALNAICVCQLFCIEVCNDFLHDYLPAISVKLHVYLCRCNKIFTLI